MTGARVPGLGIPITTSQGERCTTQPRGCFCPPAPRSTRGGSPTRMEGMPRTDPGTADPEPPPAQAAARPSTHRLVRDARKRPGPELKRLAAERDAQHVVGLG